MEKAGGAVGRAHESELIFRKPRRDSVFLLMLSLFLLLSLLLSPAVWAFLGASNGRSGSPSETVVIWSLGLLLSGLGLALAVFCFLMSFPSETRVDAERRTFERTTRRWLWGTRTLKGPLEEVSGLCVTGQGSVLLALKRRRGLLYGLEVGRAGSYRHGAALAGRLSEQLDLPVIPIPW